MFGIDSLGFKPAKLSGSSSVLGLPFDGRGYDIGCMGDSRLDEHLWTAIGYREFLAGWFEREKAHRPGLSLTMLGRKLSMDPSLLGKIFQAERHLATSRIQPVCDLVGLSGSRAEYFRHLVLHAKSKTAREAQACFERMQELRRIAPVPLEDAQESYWDRWIHVALRSFLICGDFGDDWGALGAMLCPPQGASAVKLAMRTLERLGMIRKDSQGYWRPTEPFVRDRQGSPSRALRNYHRQCLLLALEALERFDPARRNISSVAFTVDETEYAHVVGMIEDLRSRVQTRSAKLARPDRVVQLNLQLIPLASRGELPPSD
jgi:uncharacterized protein (TIGR02147 family)